MEKEYFYWSDGEETILVPATKKLKELCGIVKEDKEGDD